MINKLKAHKKDTAFAALLMIIGLAAHARWFNYIGIGAEQYWILQNLHKGFFSGFVYGDQSRPFLSLIFHLVYIFFGTSYQAVVYVNILLTFIVSLQVYFMVKALSFNHFYAALAALMVILSAGDTSTQLFSMLVVKQIVVCALGLVLILIRVKKSLSISGYQKILVFLLSLIGSYTYEVFIAFIVTFVFYLLLFQRTRVIRVYIVFVSAPVVFAVYQIIDRYLFENSQSYQSQKFVIPNHEKLFQSLETYSQGSIMPWTWGNNGLRQLFADCEVFISSAIGIWPLALSTVVTVVVLFLLIFKLPANREAESVRFDYQNVLMIVFLLLGSYIPYFFVSDGISNYRTQLLGQPFAIILLVYLLRATVMRHPFLRYTAVSIFTVYLFCWSYFGTTSLQKDNLYFAKYWADHAIFFNSLVESVPSFSPEAIILVVNVPSGSSYCPDLPRDPFEDNYWFQAGIHSYYPESYDPKIAKQVALYSHETLGKLSKDVSEVDGEMVLNLADEKVALPLNRLIVLEYEDRKAKLVNELTSGRDFQKSSYSPLKLIKPSQIQTKRTNLDIPVLEVFK